MRNARDAHGARRSLRPPVGDAVKAAPHHSANGQKSKKGECRLQNLHSPFEFVFGCFFSHLPDFRGTDFKRRFAAKPHGFRAFAHLRFPFRNGACSKPSFSNGFEKPYCAVALNLFLFIAGFPGHIGFRFDIRNFRFRALCFCTSFGGFSIRAVGGCLRSFGFCVGILGICCLTFRV